MLVDYHLHVVVVQGYREVLTLPTGLVDVLEVAESPRVLCVKADPRLEGENLGYLDGRRVQTLYEAIFAEFQSLEVHSDGIVEGGNCRGSTELELVLGGRPLGAHGLRILFEIQLKDQTREGLKAGSTCTYYHVRAEETGTRQTCGGDLCLQLYGAEG